jgi:hypothetical protein
VHIGFRTSGGRGEYEIVGGASGLPASGLDGWTFHMRWPDGQTRDTELWLDPAGSGKREIVKTCGWISDRLRGDLLVLLV